MTEVIIFLNELNSAGVCDIEKETACKSSFFSLFDLPLCKSLNEFLRTDQNEDKLGSLHIFIENHADSCDNTDKQSKMIATGIGFLKLFIQENWVGPYLPDDGRLVQITNFQSRENVLKELVVDGENVIPVVDAPEMLLLSNTILKISCSKFTNLLTSKIWYLRCLLIHQQILEELSPELFKTMTNLIDEIKKSLNEIPNNLMSHYHLEFARIYLYYGNLQNSRVEVKNATEVSGLVISLSGVLGKRTKFQKEDLAQLILKVDLGDGETLKESSVQMSQCTQPKDVKLDDDVRLDRVKYADAAHNNYPNLNGLQQAVLLGNLFQMQKSQPKDSLADEELEALISYILEQPKTWSIKMTTLLLRSKLEANHKRTVERAMMQVQVLADCLREPEISFEERFTYFFISYLPPKWEIQSTLADIMLSMGSIKSALEIYESLEKWENVIHCYNALQFRHKARKIIDQELEKNPSPKLWCLLGDATDDVSCYEKAWALSNQRSARAQKHWAYFYYYRLFSDLVKNYEECIQHLQKSLEINSLQKELWYCLGYAALMEKKWEISAHAYRRYCVLDPECFEAWNNLGRCYCELKQKYRAWRALQEALKVDYSKWKVWDNYMLVSSDLQAFDEVIKSYHEILNLKGKHLDIPVLDSLVVGYKNCQEGETRKFDKSKFKSKLLELFGRLTSQIINDEELWFLYSETVDPDTSENVTKKYQLLMKAHRSAVNRPGWEKSLENCNKVIYFLSKMVEVGERTQDRNVLMSCKLAAANTLAKIKKSYPDGGVGKDLEKNLEKISKILDS